MPQSWVKCLRELNLEKSILYLKKINLSAGAREVNFDGLVGPTHNYAGLSQGNVASQANRKKPANPREAALQGLAKMRLVASHGILQAIIPPQSRPDLAWLRRLGFTGKDSSILEKVAAQDPVLLSAAWSASAMWTANAATVSPSSDSRDGKVHITPANLSSQLHRSIEVPHTTELLKNIFVGSRFIHHPALPSGKYFGDEGAANHIRLAGEHASLGLQIFVYGYGKDDKKLTGTDKFPPRQSLSGSKAIARLHDLAQDRTVFVAQNPEAIDAGVFHNDVICVGNANILFCHESAFLNRSQALHEIRRKYANLGKGPLRIIEVKAKEIPLQVAVSTYLFNAQILSLPSGGMLLLAAEECRRDERTRKYLSNLSKMDLGITEIAFADLRQSMRNGGGPACLRLRAVLTPEEWADIPAGLKFTDTLHARLQNWVFKHYRDRVVPSDLIDPEFLKETKVASHELSRILSMNLA
jgi:succinylarginine dihydrolase